MEVGGAGQEEEGEKEGEKEGEREGKGEGEGEGEGEGGRTKRMPSLNVAREKRKDALDQRRNGRLITKSVQWSLSLVVQPCTY